MRVKRIICSSFLLATTQSICRANRFDAGAFVIEKKTHLGGQSCCDAHRADHCGFSLCTRGMRKKNKRRETSKEKGGERRKGKKGKLANGVFS